MRWDLRALQSFSGQLLHTHSAPLSFSRVGNCRPTSPFPYSLQDRSVCRCLVRRVLLALPQISVLLALASDLQTRTTPQKCSLGFLPRILSRCNDYGEKESVQANDLQHTARAGPPLPPPLTLHPPGFSLHAASAFFFFLVPHCPSPSSTSSPLCTQSPPPHPRVRARASGCCGEEVAVARALPAAAGAGGRAWRGCSAHPSPTLFSPLPCSATRCLR